MPIDPHLVSSIKAIIKSRRIKTALRFKRALKLKEALYQNYMRSVNQRSGRRRTIKNILNKEY